MSANVINGQPLVPEMKNADATFTENIQQIKVVSGINVAESDDWEF